MKESNYHRFYTVIARLEPVLKDHHKALKKHFKK